MISRGLGLLGGAVAVLLGHGERRALGVGDVGESSGPEQGGDGESSGPEQGGDGESDPPRRRRGQAESASVAANRERQRCTSVTMTGH
jgi:hypothetical protein